MSNPSQENIDLVRKVLGRAVYGERELGLEGVEFKFPRAVVMESLEELLPIQPWGIGPLHPSGSLAQLLADMLADPDKIFANLLAGILESEEQPPLSSLLAGFEFHKVPQEVEKAIKRHVKRAAARCVAITRPHGRRLRDTPVDTCLRPRRNLKGYHKVSAPPLAILR